ncbi:hypothetical protein GCM10014715_88590 [Streptomyces spiralis]|uniref:Uncharacterized protein n=1 Tax=Streptomyces spiralis TaxID=66376 RepID=A0A919APP7_9ACTN|nr:hypothetical protein [Streptomyces spiralis]GHF20303.1 hypothetical protein GCM10014715_88590 [Streptomyces spiralis]
MGRRHPANANVDDALAVPVFEFHDPGRPTALVVREPATTEGVDPATTHAAHLALRWLARP